MKSVNFCTICNYKTYSFSSFFFVTFNLETILKSSKFSVINIEEQFSFQNQNLIQSYIHCSQCLNKTKHGGFKQFFSLPNLFISIAVYCLGSTMHFNFFSKIFIITGKKLMQLS